MSDSTALLLGSFAGRKIRKRPDFVLCSWFSLVPRTRINNRTAMLRAKAQKMLPTLIPALAALFRDVDGEDGGEKTDEGAATVLVERGAVNDERETEAPLEDASDDVGGNDDDDDDEKLLVEATNVAELWSVPSCLRAESPHVFGSAVSSDFRSNVGVLAKSSSAKFSSCMWQMPLLLYSLYGKD